MHTQTQKFSRLASLGFDVPNHGTVNRADVETFYAKATKDRPALDYDIDGIVLSVESLDLLQKLGLTSDRTCPKGQIALKFPAQGSRVTIKAIEWSADGGAHLSPVAIFDPIEIAGAIVQRASLKSYRWMTDRTARFAQYRSEAIASGMTEIAAVSQANDKAGTADTVGIGSVVEVVRSGDVIPKIEAVVMNLLGDTCIPSACPCCGSEVAPAGAYLDCLNTDCEGKVANQMRRFLTTLGVKGLGQTTLVAYAEAGVTLLDFFHEDGFVGVEAKITGKDGISLAVWAKIKAQLLAAQTS